MAIFDTITIDLTRRLPDINKEEFLPNEYSRYGRFGITTKGDYFFSGIASSHPSNTKTGFYWAQNNTGDIIYISPRGAQIDLEEITKDIIVYLISCLKIKCKNIRIIKN